MTDANQMNDSFRGWATSMIPLRVYVHGHVHRLGILEGEGVVAAAPIYQDIDQIHRNSYALQIFLDNL